MRPVARPFRPLLALMAALAVLLAASACASSGGGDDARSGGAVSDAGAADRPAQVEQDLSRQVADSAEFDAAEDALHANRVGPADAPEQKIIAKGNVSLESDDVERAVFDVQRITSRHFGEITERETTTNDDDEVDTARLLLRIPVKEFDLAFTELQDAADLQSANTGKEDVTTKVIDTQVRIRAQRRSLHRVEELLDRAQSISDIIRIEAQLSHRQADLESLEQRLSYLNNQTSMSTITVDISLPPPDPKKDEKEDPQDAGFLAGLEDGWKALKSFGTDVATLSGQLLPFLTVLLVVGGPLWLLVRRFRRRTPDAPTPTPAAS